MLQFLQTLLVHERNQQQAMQRAAQAKAQGLDPQQFGTVFPGSTVTTNNTTNTTDGGSGWLKGAILGAALLTGGGGAAVGLTQYLSSPKPAVPTPAPAVAKEPPTPPPPAGKDPAWDAIFEIQQPDGSWKQVKRERLKPK